MGLSLNNKSLCVCTHVHACACGFWGGVPSCSAPAAWQKFLRPDIPGAGNPVPVPEAFLLYLESNSASYSSQAVTVPLTYLPGPVFPIPRAWEVLGSPRS